MQHRQVQEKFFIDKDGGFTAAQASTITAGGLTVTAGDFTHTLGDILVNGSGKKLIFETDTNLYRSAANILTTDDGFECKRLHANKGTLLVLGDVALTTGWGNTAAVSTADGFDSGARVVILDGGTGQAANPTVTVTFTDGAWTAAPVVVVSQSSGVDTPDGRWAVDSVTTTTAVFMFHDTPQASRTYSFNFIAIGK